MSKDRGNGKRTNKLIIKERDAKRKEINSSWKRTNEKLNNENANALRNAIAKINNKSKEKSKSEEGNWKKKTRKQSDSRSSTKRTKEIRTIREAKFLRDRSHGESYRRIRYSQIRGS